MAGTHHRDVGNPARRVLRRNTGTGAQRNRAIPYRRNPPRTPYDTAPHFYSRLSKVMEVSFQEVEAETIVPTPSLTLAEKPLRVDRSLPAEALTAPNNSPERLASFDATDSTSTATSTSAFLSYPIAKPCSHYNRKNSFIAATSLNASDSDTTIGCELEIASVEDINSTASSIHNKHHPDSNAEMSSPVIRQTRASILREQHSKSAIKEGNDYTLAVPQHSCRTVSSDHISSQKNGSPLARRDRPNRSIGLEVNQNKIIAKGDKTLSSRFSTEPAVSSTVSSKEPEPTLINDDEEGETEVVMDWNGSVNSMKHRVTRLGVGPTMRLARDASKVIYGSPIASKADGEAQDVGSANDNAHIGKFHSIEHGDAAFNTANESIDAKKQPTRPTSRKHRARNVSRDFEKIFLKEEETDPAPAIPVRLHPPRKSSLPTTPENQLPAANVPSNQSSVFSRLSRPTASSSARTKLSLTQVGKNNIGKHKNRKSESDATTSKDAAKNSSRVSRSSLAKSDTMVPVKQARKGIRERFSAMVRSGRQNRVEPDLRLSNSMQGSAGGNSGHSHDTTFIHIGEDATGEEVSQVETQDPFVITEGASQASHTPKPNPPLNHNFPRPPSSNKQPPKESETETETDNRIRIASDPTSPTSPTPPTPLNALPPFDTALSRSTSILLSLLSLAQSTSSPSTRNTLLLQIPNIHHALAAAKNARIALTHAQQAYEGLVVTCITMCGNALTSRAVAGSMYEEEQVRAREEVMEVMGLLGRVGMGEGEEEMEGGMRTGMFSGYLQAQLVQQVEALQSQLGRAHGHGHGHGHTRGHGREDSRGSSAGPVSS
ncbi:hypothetical protein ACMFMG_002485 [Clarireedia jacksonii]